MRDKTATYLFVLGMIVSFPVLLTIGLAVVSRSHEPPAYRAVSNGPFADAAAYEPTTPSSPARSLTDHPVDAMPCPAEPHGTNAATTHSLPEAATVTPVTEPQDRPSVSLDAQTTIQLAHIRQSYRQRIDELARHRDRDIALLARGLSELPSSDAAELVRELDDELVARALHQLETEQRRAVLAAFSHERGQRIQRLINRLDRG